MREKLIELLHSGERCSGVVGDGYDCCDCPHHSAENPCDEFAATADMLIANGVTIQKWIPVTERLPDSCGMFIVTVEKLYGITYSDVTYFDALSKKWGTNTHHYSCDKVTHWMALPEPHKET